MAAACLLQNNLAPVSAVQHLSIVLHFFSATLTALFHPSLNLQVVDLKASPEGEGFNPMIQTLKSEKTLLLNQLACADNHGITEVKQRVVSMESSLDNLDQQEGKYTAELDAALAQYTELQRQAVDMDTMELDTARQAIRPDKEHEVMQQLRNTYGKRFDSRMLAQSRKDIADRLDESTASVSIRQNLLQLSIRQDKQYYAKSKNQIR